MKKNNYRKLALEWFSRAEEDWGVAVLLNDEKSYPAAVCYHCHQAAEKFLKSFLVYQGKNIEEEFKIHNLIKLFDYCRKADKKFPRSLRKSCYFLNKYYVATRYPGETEEYSWDEVKMSLEAANQIKNKISKICAV